jgi:peptidoglycan/LPS O-acetylase OafA/YrhL
VIAYHLQLSWAGGGYLGVDLFFVLSGYLITSLLLDEHRRTQAIALTAFWGRRARRLLPALALLLITLALYVAVSGHGIDAKSFRGDAVATAFYAANWHFIYAHHSYFQQFGAASPLSHTWSLAIEEQFYLLWPPILLAVLAAGAGVARRRSRGALMLAVTLATASAVLMAVHFHTNIDPTRVYEGTDTRAFEPLIGAVLAIVLARRNASPRETVANRAVATIAGTAALGLFLFWVATASGPPAWMFRGGMVAVALLVAVVIWAVTGPGSGILGAALSYRPLRYVGRISYGLYLWHWPILVVTADLGLSGLGLTAVRLALTFGLAALSYHLVEQPIRRGQWAFPRYGVAMAGVAAVSVASLSILPIVSPAGATGTIPAAAASAPTIVAPATVTPTTTAVSQPAVPTSVLVVGDSTALSLWPGLVAEATPSNLVIHNGAGLGCSIVGDYTADNVYGPRRSDVPLAGCNWQRNWPPLIDRFQPRVVVLLFGPWDTADHLVGGQWLLVGTPAWRSYYMTHLSQMVDVLAAHGATVVIGTDPQYHHDPTVDEPNPSFSDPVRVDALNAVYQSFAASRPGVAILDLHDSVTLADLADGVHFSVMGRLRVAVTVDPELARLVAGPATQMRVHGAM